MSDKITYSNSIDPDQTAPEGAVWSGSTLFAILLSILRNRNQAKKKLWNKVFKILGYLPYLFSIFVSVLLYW